VTTVPIKYLLTFNITLKSLYYLEQKEVENESELVECLSTSQLRLEKIREVKFNQKLKWKVRNIRITLVAKSTGHSFGSCYFDLKLNGLRALYLGEFNDDQQGYLRPLNVDKLIKKTFHVSLIISKEPRHTNYFKQNRFDEFKNLLDRTRTNGKSNVVVFSNLPLLLEWLMIMNVLQKRGETYKVFLSKNLSLYIQLVKMLTEYMEYELTNRICEGEDEILPKGCIQLVHFKDFLMQRKEDRKVLFIYEEQLVKSDWNRLLFSPEKYNFVFIDDNNWRPPMIPEHLFRREASEPKSPNDLEVEEPEPILKIGEKELVEWMERRANCKFDARYFNTILGKQFYFEDKTQENKSGQGPIKIEVSGVSTTARTETVAQSIQTDVQGQSDNYISFDSANQASFIEHCGQTIFGFNYKDSDMFSDVPRSSQEQGDSEQYGSALTKKFFELFREEETDLIVQQEETQGNGKGAEREIGEEREDPEQNIEQKIQFNQELLLPDFEKMGQTLEERSQDLVSHLKGSQKVMEGSLFRGGLCADIGTQKLVFSRLKGGQMYLLNSGGEGVLSKEEFEVQTIGDKPVEVQFCVERVGYSWKLQKTQEIKLFSFDSQVALAMVKVKVDPGLKENHFLSFSELKTDHFWILKKNFLLGFLSYLKHSEEIENKFLDVQGAMVIYKGNARLVKNYQEHPLLEGKLGQEFLLLRKLLYEFLLFA
jgi:hypothetical protein